MTMGRRQLHVEVFEWDGVLMRSMDGFERREIRPHAAGKTDAMQIGGEIQEWFVIVFNGSDVSMARHCFVARNQLKALDFSRIAGFYRAIVKIGPTQIVAQMPLCENEALF